MAAGFLNFRGRLFVIGQNRADDSWTVRSRDGRATAENGGQAGKQRKGLEVSSKQNVTQQGYWAKQVRKSNGEIDVIRH